MVVSDCVAIYHSAQSQVQPTIVPLSENQRVETAGQLACIILYLVELWDAFRTRVACILTTTRKLIIIYCILPNKEAGNEITNYPVLISLEAFTATKFPKRHKSSGARAHFSVDLKTQDERETKPTQLQLMNPIILSREGAGRIRLYKRHNWASRGARASR